MLVHVPRKLSQIPALVVALHGCTQTAAGYDHGSGWSDIGRRSWLCRAVSRAAARQQSQQLLQLVSSRRLRRDSGEALSIRQMIERMIVDHGIDRRRMFIVGLSAGGAMAAAMLATYPEVFAGGAIIAGLPYGGAANVHAAFESMAHGGDSSAQEWGDLVRSASTHRGPWPKISIWHGTADTIVNPINMEDTLEQWINVHGADARPTSRMRSRDIPAASGAQGGRRDDRGDRHQRHGSWGAARDRPGDAAMEMRAPFISTSASPRACRS